jgi:hypothetical protein
MGMRDANFSSQARDYDAEDPGERRAVNRAGYAGG